MARKSILNNYYIFNPSVKQVVIPGGITREKLVLITNVTKNKVIYNFSDPELTATAYTIATDIRNVTTTSVTLSGTVTQNTTGAAFIGIYGNFAGYPFTGNISNTQIYNRALSAAEVSQNFNALRGRFGI